MSDDTTRPQDSRPPSGSRPPGAPPTAADRGGRTSLGYPARLPGYLASGALVGCAEVVPGVSGGTLALVLGLYDRLITGADHVVRGAVGLVRGRGGAAAVAQWRQVRWEVLVPVAVGMLTAVVLGAAAIEPLLEDHPVTMRGLFLGFIAASVAVPLRMAGRPTGVRDLAVLAGAAVLAFVLTGLPAAQQDDPNLVVVALAAAVAVCALVLPGVSGSFFLLSIGLYTTTIAAVNDRDLVYLGAFALGMVVGLSSVVRLVRWLLETHRHVTLLAMAGLMLGSLRALWPWQDEDRGLLAPSGGLEAIGTVVVVALLGAIAVGTLSALDQRLSRRAPLEDPVP